MTNSFENIDNIENELDTVFDKVPFINVLPMRDSNASSNDYIKVDSGLNLSEVRETIKEDT